jgi:hypothetical protein
MGKDQRLQELLDALDRYIDNMPPEGTADHAGFTALWMELLAYRPVVPDARDARVEPLALAPQALDPGFARRVGPEPGPDSWRPLVGRRPFRSGS